MTALNSGRVVATFGKHCLVQADQAIVDCVSRGRKADIACGDAVEFKLTSPGHGVVERVQPRRNLLYRSDPFKIKYFAANLDQVLVVTAVEPGLNENLINRCLVAAQAAGIPACIVLNKADLPQTQELHAYLKAYEAIGYPVILVSAKRDVTPLLPRLIGKTSVLIGPSGVGKSTLVNALVPEADVRTAEISRALNAGRHTTTHTRLYELPQGGALIDSPGMQEFGLHHLDLAGLQAAFPEFHRLIGQCRFYNCRHLKEPDCAITAAAATGAILPERLRAYQVLVEERLAAEQLHK
ncbi:MAG: ribosome small subunit-dependent GTPase A [Hydrogenophilaceae bacterium]|nr:ribosome small subunit-dependent GTPase A [Hydrogenophilaceae bacterium]